MNSNESTENENDDSDDEYFKQLLASLMSLYTSLAHQQAGEALVSFGQGVEKRWFNARSIRALSLTRGMSVTPCFALMVDEIQVTEFLEPDHAEAVLDEVADCLNRVLQPPQ